mgnify:CR=1 FL=1
MHSVEEIKINPEPQDASDAKEKSKLGTEKWSWQRTILSTMLEEHREKKNVRGILASEQSKSSQTKPSRTSGAGEFRSGTGMGWDKNVTKGGG